MSRNSKRTSQKVASLAAKTLNDDSASKTAKKLAASVLSQCDPKKQTGAEVEDLASKVLDSNKYNATSKTLAGSALSQSNEER